MNALVTFSGKFGDILWSMATAKELALNVIHEPVYFACAEPFAGILALLRQQLYIADAFVISNWSYQDNVLAAVPKIPEGLLPDIKSFDTVYHLSYDMLPSRPLIDYTASRAGVTLRQPIPFISPSYDRTPGSVTSLITYSWNILHRGQKQGFMEGVRRALPGFRFIDVSDCSWQMAAEAVYDSQLFLGCRSAGYVLATAMGRPTVTFEPEPGRQSETFSCPYGHEQMVYSPEQAVAAIESLISVTEHYR